MTNSKYNVHLDGHGNLDIIVPGPRRGREPQGRVDLGPDRDPGQPAVRRAARRRDDGDRLHQAARGGARPGLLARASGCWAGRRGRGPGRSTSWRTSTATAHLRDPALRQPDPAEPGRNLRPLPRDQRPGQRPADRAPAARRPSTPTRVIIDRRHPGSRADPLVPERARVLQREREPGRNRGLDRRPSIMATRSCSPRDGWRVPRRPVPVHHAHQPDLVTGHHGGALRERLHELRPAGSEPARSGRGRLASQGASSRSFVPRSW